MTERHPHHDDGQQDQLAAQYVADSLAAQDSWLRSTVAEEAQLRGWPDLLVLGRRLALAELVASPPADYRKPPEEFHRGVSVIAYASEIALFNEAISREAHYTSEYHPDGSYGVTYSLPSFHPDTTVGTLHHALEASQRALAEPLGRQNALTEPGLAASAPLQDTVAGIVSAAGVRRGHVPEWLPLDRSSLTPRHTLWRMDEHAQDIVLQRAQVHDIVRFVGDRPETA